MTVEMVEKGSNFYARFFSSLVLWGVLLFVILYGLKIIEMIIFIFFGVLALEEFYRMQEVKGNRVFRSAGLSAAFCLYVGIWFFWNFLPNGSSFYYFFEQALYFIFIASLFSLVIYRWNFLDNPVSAIALTLLGFFYVAFLFSFLERISFCKGLPFNADAALFYVIAVTKLSDTGAFLIGKNFGRRFLVPQISPKKTWEGLGGGILFSFLAGVILPFGFSKFFKGFPYSDSLFLSVVIGIVAAVGDLAKSTVKRDAHVKDSGHIIPGIGGILDLIDSLLLSGPLFYFYCFFRYHIGP
ncbi:phosphatidate cytidylyltransferase [Candidatus Methylacidiphilum infernorum]|uniref:Phosphatidate cytidylyltransferase n=1 Tax=Candidatus Methylacidiphilum infernorum TaxID=511746 RepID=A0ABX7PSM7_9BACT|nr:phosphatidate cytidylyltransferase [Candidatus Methylacidiphilum infernorum]QSR85986.1 phosphatidate cytidylyltransferase [Candidatus Methylacidiphilum infernorum]